MKLFLVDGTVREVPLARGYTGYRAERIEIDANDVADMRRMAMRAPTMFNIVMRQLEARFRKGGDVVEVNNAK